MRQEEDKDWQRGRVQRQQLRLTILTTYLQTLRELKRGVLDGRCWLAGCVGSPRSTACSDMGMVHSFYANI